LDECIRQGIKKDIRISPELRTDVNRFSVVYASKGLEYFSLMFFFVPPELPRLDRIQRFIAHLDGKMLRKVQNST
jgi:hypothetical protein